MNNGNILKKTVGIVASFAVVAMMLLSLPSVEVRAALSDFNIVSSDVNAHVTYASLGNVETVTVTGAVDSINYTGSGTGNVVVANNALVNGNITTNGDVTVNSGGRVLGNVETTTGNVDVSGVVTGHAKTQSRLTISGTGTVGGVLLTGDATIDSTNLSVNIPSGGSFTVPIAQITRSGGAPSEIEIDGNITVTGTVPNPVAIDNSASGIPQSRTLTVENSGSLNDVGVSNQGATTVNIVAGGSINGNIAVTAQGANVTINGNMTGDVITSITGRNSSVTYASGTLTGSIGSDAQDGIATVGAAAIVTGNVSAGGNVIVNGTVNNNVTSVNGVVILDPAGSVGGTISPPLSDITINGTTLAYNRYYPISSAGVIDQPQSTVPTGGYARITTNGTQGTIELNNANLSAHDISASTSQPLTIHLTGTNSTGNITYNQNITMIAAQGGELSCGIIRITGSNAFTLQSGTVRATGDPGIGGDLIAADVININGGEIFSETTLGNHAFSVFPTITPSVAGTEVIVMAGASLQSATQLPTPLPAAYHNQAYVHINLVPPVPTPTPTPAPTVTTTTTTTQTVVSDPHIAPLTGVYE